MPECPLRPVLYSFRRCPYAIRARMAIAYADVAVELREVLLREKPAEMLHASPKATVPVLVLDDGEVIDESMQIMQWALAQADPQRWLATQDRELNAWVTENDNSFKAWLDRYKYADRFPEHSVEWYREQAMAFPRRLDRALQEHAWLAGDCSGFADVAVFPFIRQFAMVDKAWFDDTDLTALQRWLERMLDSDLFRSVMDKYPRWESGSPGVAFPTQRAGAAPGAPRQAVAGPLLKLR